MGYYSSNQVDRVIERLLPEVGYAVDVGANDGKFFSNTLHLEEKGWTVLCVEPNPLLSESGRALRKLWVSAAAGAEDREAEFFAVGAEPYASTSTIDLGDNKAQKFVVPMMRLDRILEEAGFNKLDLLSVDVETYEDKVMAGFTIDRWKPTIMVIEHLQGPAPAPEGYASIGRYEYDDVYVRNVP